MSQKRTSVTYSVNKDIDEQGEPPYTPNFIAAGLHANVDDRRAGFSTSWVQSVNQFSNTKVLTSRFTDDVVGQPSTSLRYWQHLGETDEQRATAHQERVTAKTVWALEIRKALQRALNDVRCCRPYPVADILIPSSKRRRSLDESGCMRCAIHCQQPPEADD
ncbi:unnamed protein product [Heligmosomoides polygyrus]|uniref:Uncharacterized protein n=1 Tax=Heligmosomoides polygyrus TaxID=6339 RepID=A0A183F9A5_HELPZ|nr:unnamed protein product [Heligmosomoides polygyrus]